MLLDMEHHSALLSLNMSPFNLSPGGPGTGGGSQGGGNQGGGGQGGGNQTGSAALTPSSLAPPSLYGSPPQWQSQAQPHQQQGLAHQQAHHHQQAHQHQQGQQAHQHNMLMSNLDACLFPGADYPASAVRPDLPDTKEGIEELCPVCGDKVSGYHYGLLTCESCKGFFKRTVQNKKVYTCVADRSCHIDKTQRKRCPFCRFQKCLEVGMKLEAVRADRMRGGRNKFGPMYKRDRARKLQMLRQRQIAVQTIRGHSTHSSHSSHGQGAAAGGGGALSDSGLSYPSQPASFASLHIKQEIQIPQVSSLTSSPDSSPSPIAVALGQASVSAPHTASHAASTPPGLQLAGPAGQGTPGSSNAPATNLAANSDHKLWGGTGGGTGGGGGGGGTPSRGDLLDGLTSTSKMTPMMRDLVQSVDDREWQNSLFGLLQNQTYNQCEVDLFELMCKVLDQNLFSQVDWARNSCFFKDLKVDDQMKLLQYSWSDMLVLDHLHQRLHNQLPDETTLPNGQKFDLLCLGLLGVASLADQFAALAHQFANLKFDVSDYICLKFLLLLNPDVRGIMNRKHVQEGHNQVKTALHDYSLTHYPHIQGKFDRLLLLLPDIHEMAARGEDHLYQKHCSGGAPTQTLLMEMLHAKRK